MKIARTNIVKEVTEDNVLDEVNFNIRQIDDDIVKLFTAMQGRVRFGTGTTGDRGENIHGEFVTFTSNASANTEFSVTHSIGAVPIGYLVIGQDKAGSLYQLNGTGTSWTNSTIYLKSSGASVTYSVFLLQ